MKIALLLGSIRQGRHSHKAAYHLSQCLQQHPQVSQVHIWDLATHPLPLMDTPASTDTNVVMLQQLLQAADGVVLVSPEYHGSYTGVLKNALDYLGGNFKAKPIAVLCTGSGKMGGINASVQLQHLILSMGCYPMPQKLLVPFVDQAFDEANQQPNDAILAEQFVQFAHKVAQFCQAITQIQQLP